MIGLIGMTSSGKSTIREELINMEYIPVISWTTRSPRPGEIGGVDYNFVTDEEFKTLEENGFFAETTSYVMVDGKKVCYGTAIEDLLENRVAILNPEGLKNLRKLKSLNLVPFWIVADEETLIERLKQRGDKEAEYKRRLEADKRDFSGLVHDVDFVIRNEGRMTPQMCAEMINYLYKKKVGWNE